ncbi:MAG: LON peptidase substrate-binding domain-containing protein [Saprospiraceae bacterium]
MQLIPLFPLRMIVFPNEKVNLHVFEPRYKQLINDCLPRNLGGNSEDISFCIPFYNKNRLMPTVAEVRLTEITKIHDDGKMDVKTQATEKIYRIKKVRKDLSDKLYSVAVVEPLQYDYHDSDSYLALQIQEKMTLLYELLSIDKEIPSIKDLMIFDVGHYLGLSQMQEFQLLTITSENARQEFVLNHLENFIPTVQKMQHLQRKAKLNGHFKNLLPPDFKITDL